MATGLKEFIDVGVSTTSFITELLEKSSIPGLSIGSFLIKRGIDIYAAKQYLENEGIKNLIVFKHMCDNIKHQVENENRKTPELIYVFNIFKDLTTRVDNLLRICQKSAYSDILQQEDGNYRGIKASAKNSDKIELIPIIINFIKTHFPDKNFDVFVDAHLNAFDQQNVTVHEALVNVWKTSGFAILNKSYSTFIEGQIRKNKKSQEFPQILELWQTYMDTVSGFTQIEDIHLFVINYKTQKISQAKDKNVLAKFKKHMIDPVKMKMMINETIQELDEYIDAILILLRQVQTVQIKVPSVLPVQPKSKHVSPAALQPKSSPAALQPKSSPAALQPKSSPAALQPKSKQVSPAALQPKGKQEGRKCVDFIEFKGVRYYRGKENGVFKLGSYNNKVYSFKDKEMIKQYVLEQLDKLCR